MAAQLSLSLSLSLLLLLTTAAATATAARAPLYGRPNALRLFSGPSPDPASPTGSHTSAELNEVLLFAHVEDAHATDAACLAPLLSLLTAGDADADQPGFTARVEAQYGAVCAVLVQASAEALDAARDLDGVELAQFDEAVVHIFAEEEVSRWVSNEMYNLDRIDQRFLPRDNDFVHVEDGTGVDVYVVDSGVRADHVEFSGRATFTQAYTGTAVDCNGHGTHVAGTIGGDNTGLAKGVNLIGVKVIECDGTGSVSAFTSGINYVITQYNSASVKKPTILNLSLGASLGSGAAIVQVVEQAVDAGVIVVTAAGNSAADACNVVPASSSKVITVTATGKDDEFATDFANWGTCVDIVAPGDYILSSSSASSNSYAYRTGTSMAAPLVSAIAATYVAVHPSATTADVKEALLCAGSPNMVRNLEANTPNVLAYSRWDKSSFCATTGCTEDAQCSGHGTCSAGGKCECDCGYTGHDCSHAHDVLGLTSQSGSHLGSTSAAQDLMGVRAPEVVLQFTVPAAGSSMSLSLCSTATNIDATLSVLASCPGHSVQPLDTIATAGPGQQATACASYSTSSAPASLAMHNVAAGTYWVVIEAGADDTPNAGTFELQWHIEEPRVDCQVSPWAAWSNCSIACGSGTRSRSRVVIVPASGGGTACPTEMTQSDACNLGPCPCLVSEWSEWGFCDSDCGAGNKQRTRTVLDAGDTTCPALAESAACTSPCNADCVVSAWADWSACSAQCGGGTATRTRTIVQPPTGLGAGCPDLSESGTCNTQYCFSAVLELELTATPALPAGTLSPAVAGALRGIASAAVPGLAGQQAVEVVPASAGASGNVATSSADPEPTQRFQCTVGAPTQEGASDIVTATSSAVSGGSFASSVSTELGSGTASSVTTAVVNVAVQSFDGTALVLDADDAASSDSSEGTSSSSDSSAADGAEQNSAGDSDSDSSGLFSGWDSDTKLIVIVLGTLGVFVGLMICICLISFRYHHVRQQEKSPRPMRRGRRGSAARGGRGRGGGGGGGGGGGRRGGDPIAIRRSMRDATRVVAIHPQPTAPNAPANYQGRRQPMPMHNAWASPAPAGQLRMQYG